MKQDEFLAWLFEKFNMPESRYVNLTRIYGKALPEDSDFEHLKSSIIKEWKTPTTLPTINWLRYRAYTRAKKEDVREFGAPCEAVRQHRENRKAFLSNYQECRNAMRECMAYYERISGRKITKEV